MGSDVDPQDRMRQTNSLQQSDQATGLALDPPGKFELEQRDPHHGGRLARQSHKIVDRHRRRAQEADDAGSRTVIDVGMGRVHSFRFFKRHSGVAAKNRLKDGDDVRRCRRTHRSLFDKIVGSFSARIER